jgi:hypothetical protein
MELGIVGATAFSLSSELRHPHLITSVATSERKRKQREVVATAVSILFTFITFGLTLLGAGDIASGLLKVGMQIRAAGQSVVARVSARILPASQQQPSNMECCVVVEGAPRDNCTKNAFRTSQHEDREDFVAMPGKEQWLSTAQQPVVLFLQKDERSLMVSLSAGVIEQLTVAFQMQQLMFDVCVMHDKFINHCIVFYKPVCCHRQEHCRHPSLQRCRVYMLKVECFGRKQGQLWHGQVFHSAALVPYSVGTIWTQMWCWRTDWVAKRLRQVLRLWLK